MSPEEVKLARLGSWYNQGEASLQLLLQILAWLYHASTSIELNMTHDAFHTLTKNAFNILLLLQYSCHQSQYLRQPTKTQSKDSKLISWRVPPGYWRTLGSAMSPSHLIFWPAKGITRVCYQGFFISWNMEAAILAAANQLASTYFPTHRWGHQSVSVKEINCGTSSEKTRGI